MWARRLNTETRSATGFDASYMPPTLAGTGGHGYLFNAGRQPTAISPTDGQTTEFGYEAGGRLSGVMFSHGTLGYSRSHTVTFGCNLDRLLTAGALTIGREAAAGLGISAESVEGSWL